MAKGRKLAHPAQPDEESLSHTGLGCSLLFFLSVDSDRSAIARATGRMVSDSGGRTVAVAPAMTPAQIDERVFGRE
jgi:hypothetical protein